MLVASALGEKETAIPVAHARASKVLELLNHGLIPSGAVVRADDAHSRLLVSGSSEDLKTISSYVGLFDVRARPIRLDVTIDSEADRVHKTLSTEVANNAKWSFEDSDLNIKVQIIPRINDDATITDSVSSTYGNATQASVIRLRSGQTLYLRPGAFAQKDGVTAKGQAAELKRLDDQTVPTILLKLTSTE